MGGRTDGRLSQPLDMTRERTRRTRRSVQSARTRWDRGGSTTVAAGRVVVMETVAMEVVR